MSESLIRCFLLIAGTLFVGGNVPAQDAKQAPKQAPDATQKGDQEEKPFKRRTSRVLNNTEEGVGAHVELAINGRPMVRPQAGVKLRKIGGEGRRVVLQRLAQELRMQGPNDQPAGGAQSPTDSDAKGGAQVRDSKLIDSDSAGTSADAQEGSKGAATPMLTEGPQEEPKEEFEGWYDLGVDFLKVAAFLSAPDEDGKRYPGHRNSPEIEKLAAEMRAALWRSTTDRAFAWRVGVVDGLGESPLPQELSRFPILLQDPLSSVRRVSLTGLAHLPQESIQVCLKRAIPLEHDDRVQREMAKLAVQVGVKEMAWVLFDDLDNTETYFDQPVGHRARIEAARQLAECLPLAPKVVPQNKPGTSLAIREEAALEAYLEEHIGPQPKPSKPLSGLEFKGKETVGLELRSCREGEFFLTWSSADQLWVGRSDPLVLALPEGTVAKLIELANSTAEVMGKDYLTGKPGCDMESFHFRLPPERPRQRFLVCKGPEPVPGLRPDALQVASEALLASLPNGDHADARAHRLQDQIRRALVSIGGELPKD